MMSSTKDAGSSDDEIVFFPVIPTKSCKEDDSVIFLGQSSLKNEKKLPKKQTVDLSSVGKDVTIVSCKKKRAVETAIDLTSDDEVQYLGPAPKTKPLKKLEDRAKPDNVNIKFTINIDDNTPEDKVQARSSAADKEEEEEEVQFCGIKKRSSKAQLRSKAISHLNSHNVTVVPKKLMRISENQQDVKTNEKVFIHKTGKKADDGKTIAPKINERAARGRSDSLNISINSKVTINIEDDAENNKKKVELTFLGPSRKNKNNLLVTPSSNNSPKLMASSTPLQQKTNFHQNNPYTFLHSSPILPPPVEKDRTLGSQVKECVIDISDHDEPPDVLKVKDTTPIINRVNSEKSILTPRKIESSFDSTKKKSEQEENYEKKENTSSNSLGNREDLAVPGPSKASSTEAVSESDEDSSSSESTNSENECSEPTMTKAALDVLFNKFLAGCTSISKKNDIIKMENRLKKLYQNTKNLTVNKDFILALKEGYVRVDGKSVRCPLAVMKKVYYRLKKDTPANERNIRRLETMLKKINDKIKTLEEAEVCSEEEECDNNYVVLDRYRKRAVQIYSKLCELAAIPDDADRPTLRNVYFQATVPEVFIRSKTIPNLMLRVSRALEKYHNKTRKFPDFYDVRSLMTKLSREENLKIKKETLHELSKSIFQEFGDLLQKRRLYDEYKICNEYLQEDDDDPYYVDPILAAKLDQNKQLRKAEKEILDSFTIKQVTYKEGNLSDEASNSSEASDFEEDIKKNKAFLKRKKIYDSDNSDSGSSTDRSEKKKKRNISGSDKCSGKVNVENKSKRHLSSEKITDQSFKRDEESNLSPDLNRKMDHKESDNDQTGLNKEQYQSFSDTLKNFEYENASTILASSFVDGLEQNRGNNRIEAVAGSSGLRKGDSRPNIIHEKAESIAREDVPTGDHVNSPILINEESSEAKDFVNSNENSSGLIITNIVSMQGNGETQEAPQTQCEGEVVSINLLSDDEEGRPSPRQNVLSQEDVLDLIPIILSQPD